MVSTILKEFEIPALNPNESYIVAYDGNRLSESSIKDLLPALGISVLNQGSEKIKVYINDTVESGIRLPGNSSRSINGIPAHDIAVMNIGANPTVAGDVLVTICNDLEQVSRYKASNNRNNPFRSYQ